MSDKIKYEDCLARVNEISGLLSSGSVELEQSISLYKEATELLAKCRQMLQDAELSITEISSGV